RNDLENELTYKKRRDVRNQMISSLMARVSFDLPESMVQQEIRTVVYDVVRENQKRGVPPEKIDEQKDQIYGYASNSARDRLKVAFLLGRIAEAEKIDASNEEITRHI